jgi:hypothetical protein
MFLTTGGSWWWSPIKITLLRLRCDECVRAPRVKEKQTYTSQFYFIIIIIIIIIMIIIRIVKANK